MLRSLLLRHFYSEHTQTVFMAWSYEKVNSGNFLMWHFCGFCDTAARTKRKGNSYLTRRVIPLRSLYPHALYISHISQEFFRVDRVSCGKGSSVVPPWKSGDDVAFTAARISLKWAEEQKIAFRIYILCILRQSVIQITIMEAPRASAEKKGDGCRCPKRLAGCDTQGRKTPAAERNGLNWEIASGPALVCRGL